MDGIGDDSAAGRRYAKGERRRAEIVQAAFEAFGTLGYRTASLVQIAADCGVSRAGLVHYFPTKEALLAAVLDERDRAGNVAFFEGADVESDGVAYLSRLVRLVEHNASVPGMVRLFAVLSTEASDPDHPAHDYFVARYARLRHEFRHAFEVLHRQGQLRAGVDPEGLDAELIALMDGLQVQWLLDPTQVDMGRALRHRLAEIVAVDLP